MTFCCAGALIGFLYWNFPHGRIFAGDSGALFAGAVAALASLMIISRTDVPPFVPPILFMPLLADALLTLAWRMRADAALGALVSSKVNQWTLLIGCLPIAYAVSSGSIDPLPTDTRQAEEVLLTAAQSLLAVILLINLRMSLWEAAVLGLLFLAQFLTPHSIVSRDVFTLMYLVAAAMFLVRQAVDLRPYMRRGAGPGLQRPASAD